MEKSTNKLDSGAPQGARRATEDAPESRPIGGRWSAKRKTTAVVRLLRGQDLESLSRELGVTAATLSHWREEFLAGGEAYLKTREVHPEDEEKQRLKSVLADLTMRNELLREKIHHLEAGRPLARWRSRL